MAKEKNTVCAKKYITESGEEVSHWQIGVVALRFKFANGSIHDVTNEFESDMDDAFKWFGRSEKLGNGYADSKQKSEKEGVDQIEWAEDAFLSLYERIKVGEFNQERVSIGPRISHMVLAVVNLKAKKGITVDPVVVAETLKDKDARERIEADKMVMAEIARIKAEIAVAKAKQTAEEAETAEATDALDLF